MKAVLFLCLLAFMTCEKDIIDIGKCIYKAPLVKELISDVIVAIAAKDYSKLLPKIKESLPELIQIVLGFLVDSKANEDQTNLSINPIPIGGDPDLICHVRCLNRGTSYDICKKLCLTFDFGKK